MKEDMRFDTFEELFSVVWDDTPRTPEDRAADWYAEINYEEIQDGKVVHKNVLEDLLEPALAGASQHGCRIEDLQRVMPVGGGAQLPLLIQWLS